MDLTANHYAQLLGLQSPWKVTGVDLDVDALRVDIRVVFFWGQVLHRNIFPGLPSFDRVEMAESDTRDTSLIGVAECAGWRHAQGEMGWRNGFGSKAEALVAAGQGGRPKLAATVPLGSGASSQHLHQ